MTVLADSELRRNKPVLFVLDSDLLPVNRIDLLLEELAV